jgi:hypothetical protein
MFQRLVIVDGVLQWPDVEEALKVAMIGARADLAIYTLPSEVGKF